LGSSQRTPQLYCGREGKENEGRIWKVSDGRGMEGEEREKGQDRISLTKILDAPLRTSIYA